RRDACPVGAFTADQLALNDGYSQPARRQRGRAVLARCAATEDDHVVVGHFGGAHWLPPSVVPGHHIRASTTVSHQGAPWWFPGLQVRSDERPVLDVLERDSPGECPRSASSSRPRPARSRICAPSGASPTRPASTTSGASTTSTRSSPTWPRTSSRG